jgi:hypothetical protein
MPVEQSYDYRHVVFCLQGLVNRNAPRMFVRFFEDEDDLIWLTRVREANGFCENWNVEKVETLEALFEKFGTYVTGVVLYEPEPENGPASTSMVATTVAGAENCVAVRKDTSAGSLYNWLVNDSDGPKLPVFIDLTGKFTDSGTIWQTSIPSTGSAKCDAYIWAIEKYLKTGKSNPSSLGLYLDLAGLRIADQDFTDLMNLDYMVAKKGFCFDLSPFADERPNDDLSQPLGTDRATLNKILDECNNRLSKSRMIEVCGFPDWQYKYSTSAGGIHDPVYLEQYFAAVMTIYNGYLDVDFMLPNMSFYAGFWPVVQEKHLVQNPAPSYNDFVSRGLINASGQVVPGNYICVIFGDFDCTAWSALRMAYAGKRYSSSGGIWMDRERGNLYCNWGINPNLVKRVSAVFDYIYRLKSGKDYFVAWDSGAGYIIPSNLRSRSENGYPSGVSLWQKHCRDLYRITDYSITGWLLERSSLTSSDAQTYSSFSTDGVGGDYDGQGFSFWNPSLYDGALLNNVPFNNLSGGSDTTQYHMIDYPTGVHFASYRAVNWNTDGSGTYIPWGPDELKILKDQYSTSGHNHQFLDAYSFYYLMRYYYGGNNNYRATWMGDAVPKIMKAASTYTVSVTVRNDGWNSWPRSQSYGLGFSIEPEGSPPLYYKRSYGPDGSNIGTGQTITYTFDITAPQTPGIYDVQYDMVQEGVTWFANKGNIEWKGKVTVVADEYSVDTDGDGCSDLFEIQNGMLYWHPDDCSMYSKEDLIEDGVIDLKDFAEFAKNWMSETN